MKIKHIDLMDEKYNQLPLYDYYKLMDRKIVNSLIYFIGSTNNKIHNLIMDDRTYSFFSDIDMVSVNIIPENSTEGYLMRGTFIGMGVGVDSTIAVDQENPFERNFIFCGKNNKPILKLIYNKDIQKLRNNNINSLLDE